MRKGSRGRGGLRFLSIALAIAVVLPLIVAFHWARLGWRDEHVNYPSRPSGYTQIVNRFGQPCNAEARAISMRWQGGGQRGDVLVQLPSQARWSSDGDGLGQGREVDQPGQRRVRAHPERPSAAVRRARDLRVRVPGQAEQQPVEHPRVRDRDRRVLGRGVHGQVHVDGQQEPRVDLAEPRLVLGLAFCDPMHFQYATNY